MTSSTLQWPEVPLGQVAHFVMGQAPPGEASNFEGQGTPFVKAGEFREKRPIIREWTTRPLKLAKSTDVLMCVVGATSGKLNLGADCAIGRSVAAIRPKSDTFAEFLYYQLLPKVQSLRAASTGSAQGVISKDILDSIPIRLPPLPVQHRIVAKLDSLFDHSKHAREELARIPKLVERYKQAVLEKAFRGELTADWRLQNGVSFDLDWRSSSLGALSTDIRYGTAAKCHYEPGKTPVLRIPNVANGCIDLSDLKYGSFSDVEKRKLALQAGDILVIRSNGSLALVGRAALVPELGTTHLYAGYLIRLRVDQQRIIPAYVLHAFEQPTIRRHIEGLAKSTSGVNNINSEQLRAIPIIVPPLTEQTEIIRRISSTLSAIAHLFNQASRATSLLDRLDQATLAKAFRGELVNG